MSVQMEMVFPCVLLALGIKLRFACTMQRTERGREIFVHYRLHVPGILPDQPS
jgi:hypothetical protein